MYRNIDFDISDDGVGYLQSNSRFLPALAKNNSQHYESYNSSTLNGTPSQNNGYHLS